MNRLPKRALGVASAGLLVAGGAVALAAPDRKAPDLSSSNTTYEWDGGPITAGPVGALDTDDTGVKLTEGGALTINLSKFADDGGMPDFDIYLYKADADGNPDGSSVGSSAEADTTKETLTVKNLKAGPYVIVVDGFLTLNGTFHGKATFAGSGGGGGTTTGPSGPSGPTGVSGPSGPTGSLGPVSTGSDETPDATVKKPASKPKKFTGTAKDDVKVTKVEIALQLQKGKKCTQLKKTGKFAKQKKCGAPSSFLKAKGTTKWSFKLKKKLKKGSYTVFARATDSAGQKQAGFTPANKRTFKVKK